MRAKTAVKQVECDVRTPGSSRSISFHFRFYSSLNNNNNYGRKVLFRLALYLR